MITRRTKIQLIVFVAITLLGCTFVGARYAQLDRVFFDRTYTVVAHLDDSGGAFVGAEVTYRGTTIGQVEDMKLTEDGVDVYLEIENEWDEIPTPRMVPGQKETPVYALVGNRSAVGEQYVELQPATTEGPYLEDGSEIPEEYTALPIPTAKLLGDISNTVNSVDREDLRTVVRELGIAFDGTGEDLAQIIDTSNSFIQTADENFELTRDLIRDTNTVLTGQLSTASSIRSFSRNLALFSGTLADSDPDLRTVIDSGSATANEVRTFIEENQVDLASLLNNLRTVSEVVVKRLDGVEHLLSIYPYVVEGGFTVVAKDPETGNFDAHFGLVLTPHAICHQGYESTDRRNPFDGSNRPLKTDVGCTEPASKSNARGGQHAPRAGADYSAPVVAEYDRKSGSLTWLDEPRTLTVPGSLTARPNGEETWKWLMLRPVGQTSE